jgi:hypothetical protein
MAAAALGQASDTMMAHPLALQLRNLQTLAELGVEKNTTVVFPAPMMSAIGEISSFLTRETAAAQQITTPPAPAKPPALAATDGEPANGAAVEPEQHYPHVGTSSGGPDTTGLGDRVFTA